MTPHSNNKKNWWDRARLKRFRHSLFLGFSQGRRFSGCSTRSSAPYNRPRFCCKPKFFDLVFLEIEVTSSLIITESLDLQQYYLILFLNLNEPFNFVRIRHLSFIASVHASRELKLKLKDCRDHTFNFPPIFCRYRFQMNHNICLD